MSLTESGCRHSVVPGYLIDLCQPVASIDGHKHLRFASRGQLQVSRIKMATYVSRAFGHAGLRTLCRTLSNAVDAFTILSDVICNIFTTGITNTSSVFEVVTVNARTYILTYLDSTFQGVLRTRTWHLSKVYIYPLENARFLLRATLHKI